MLNRPESDLNEKGKISFPILRRITLHCIVVIVINIPRNIEYFERFKCQEYFVRSLKKVTPSFEPEQCEIAIANFLRGK